MDDKLHLSKTEIKLFVAASRRMDMKSVATSVNEYLSRLTPDKRTALERLRKTIKSAAPGAEECISYQMPAFRLDGRMLVWFGATSNHCAFYPGGVVGRYEDELKGYKTSKGTIQFQPDHPIPTRLVLKIVKARIAENKSRTKKGEK